MKEQFSNSKWLTAAVLSTALVSVPQISIAQDSSVDKMLDQIDSGPGQVVIGARTENGNVTEWSDVKITDEKDQGGLMIDWIRLEQNGDSALITISEVSRLMIESNDGQPEAIVEFRNTGLEIVMTDAGNEMRRTMSADNITLELVEGTDDAQFFVSMDNMSGQHLGAIDNLFNGAGAAEFGNISVSYALDPEGQGLTTGKSDMSEMSITYSYDGPADAMENEPDPADFDLSFSLESPGGTSQMSMPSDVGPINLDTSSGESVVSFGMQNGLLGYNINSNDITYLVDIPAMGMSDVPAELGTVEMKFQMPLAKSDAPQPLEMAIALRDLIVGDQVWAMFDPQALLPREPATIAIGASGEAVLTHDLADADEMVGKMPFKVQNARIDEFVVALAGADISGAGDFTFNNSGPIPMPIGQVEFNINGLNGLLEKLGQLGLLQPEQAMPARMMLGMFATPVGDDQLRSTIEMKPDGSILANGQRIK